MKLIENKEKKMVLWLREEWQGSEVVPANKTATATVRSLYVVSQQLRNDTCLKFSLHGSDISEIKPCSNVEVGTLNRKHCPLKWVSLPSPSHLGTHIQP